MRASFSSRDIEPVSVVSNRVSSNKTWISKNRDQRLASETRRMLPEFQEVAPQRLCIIPLTPGNVALIFSQRTCGGETGLVRWDARIRTWKCCFAKSPLKCREDFA